MIRLNERFQGPEALVPLNGFYDRKFAPVLEAFLENYRREEEIGSAHDNTSGSTTPSSA
jgi:hypothetical protein